MKNLRTALLISAAILASSIPAQSANPRVKIYEDGDQRCVESNGVPNHKIGKFPNSGNPHRFSEQRLKYCFPKNPERNWRAIRGTPIVGIALNGIVLRPGTADWYDASSPRGFSRNSASGWNLEGMGSASALGIDKNNAHVDNQGLYHYHGPPPAIVLQGSLLGYAADGFEIHYVGKTAQPSYQLKKGTRPTAPGGAYDGRFVEDWEYVKGSGILDECNGANLEGKYVYFATDTFPFFPRCHWGEVSADFQHQRGPSNNQPQTSRGRGGPLSAAAEELGVSERRLAEAVGPPPPNIKRAAKILGISETRLEQVLRKHRPR